MPVTYEFDLARLSGFHVTLCIIVEWHIPDNSPITDGDIAATVETSKVTAELSAKASGILRHKYRQGEYVPIDDIIGWVE